MAAEPVPPLHRRFDEQESLAAICRRYSKLQPILARQVEALQNSSRARAAMGSFYGLGYKDWHLASTIFNMRLQAELPGDAFRFGNRIHNDQMKRFEEKIARTVQKPIYFTNVINFQHCLNAFDINCLMTYGFEYRRRDYNPEVVKSFLRRRMRHYDFDLPHAPLFGDIPGEWPEIA